MKRAGKRRGLSLLEIMLALALFGIVALSLVLMFTRGMIVLGSNKQVAGATASGQAFLERVRSKGSGFITLGTFDGRAGDLPDDTTGFPPWPYPLTPEGYALVVTASTAGVPSGLISVKVDVYFEAGRKVSMESYFKP